MVKLPISDYVANYYKEEGIEFTLRQQAHFCWYYNDQLKDKLNSVREILEISNDEKLNIEIRERIAYEENAYKCFMTDREGCIYAVHLDDCDAGCYDEYFSSAKKAVIYGIHHSERKFQVQKRWLFDRNPKGLSEEADDGSPEGFNGILSDYEFTSGGDVICGTSYECRAPFDEEDCSRFEDMFLYIKSPFGFGDIVMGPDFERPEVVSTGHDCFIEHYDKMKARGYMQFEGAENIIRTDLINADGSLDYAHTVPFSLWRIDSWEDKEYWKLLQIMSQSLKKDAALYDDLFDLEILRYEYVRRNQK